MIFKDKGKVNRYYGKRINIFEVGIKDVSLEREFNRNFESKSDCFICKVIFMVRNCEVVVFWWLREEVCYFCGVEIKVVVVCKRRI